MTCPVCGAPLGESQTRCSGCGYSFSEPIDLQADVAPPGVRPKEVILATKLLAFNLGLSVAVVLFVIVRLGVFRLMSSRGIWILGAGIALHALFIALIWWGVRWARILFLFVMACRVVLMIWGLMAAATVNQVSGYIAGSYSQLSIDFVIDFLVAYLLIQPESRNWFYDTV